MYNVTDYYTHPPFSFHLLQSAEERLTLKLLLRSYFFFKMLPHFLQKLCNRQNVQLILILLVITSFGLVIQNNSYWGSNFVDSSEECLPDEGDSTDNKFVSSLCNCGKEIPVPKDFDINSTLNDQFHWCSEESSVRGPSQKIVTYALFGNAQNASVFRRYFSLLRNISLTVDKQYPGWIIRIYHDILDGDEDAHDQLCKVYCRYPNVDLCSVPLLANRIGNETSPIDPALLRGLNPKMFRYLVMLDPNVDLFISRDVDSIIFRREVDAVEEWLKSNYTFHLMRDHRGHGSIILAGYSMIF